MRSGNDTNITIDQKQNGSNAHNKSALRIARAQRYDAILLSQAKPTDIKVAAYNAARTGNHNAQRI